MLKMLSSLMAYMMRKMQYAAAAFFMPVIWVRLCWPSYVSTVASNELTPAEVLDSRLRDSAFRRLADSAKIHKRGDETTLSPFWIVGATDMDSISVAAPGLAFRIDTRWAARLASFLEKPSKNDFFFDADHPKIHKSPLSRTRFRVLRVRCGLSATTVSIYASRTAVVHGDAATLAALLRRAITVSRRPHHSEPCLPRNT